MISQVEHLDIQNETAVREYEEGFYRAFAPVSNPGIRAIWIWDDEAKRLRTKIPYEHQDIFVVRDAEGKVNTACAFNTKLEMFQSGEYGFERPPTEPRWFETIVAYNARRGPLLAALERARLTLTARGFEYVYATCAEKVLDWNRRVGFEVLERSEQNSVVRYFLRMDLTKPFI